AARASGGGNLDPRGGTRYPPRSRMPSPARSTEAERGDAPGGGRATWRTGVFDRASRATTDRSRTRVRARRWAARALIAAFALAVIGTDVAIRHARLAQLEAAALAFYAASALASVVLWTSLAALASSARGRAARSVARALLVVGALLAVGGQLYTYDHYQAYLNHRAVLVGTSFLPSVGQQLWFDRWSFARALVPWLALACALPWLARRLAPLRSARRRWLCADLALAAALTAAVV